MKKAITHEEARKEIEHIDSYLDRNSDGFTDVLKQYITQQEKVEELLKEYQFWFSQEDKSDLINVLEATIKE